MSITQRLKNKKVIIAIGILGMAVIAMVLFYFCYWVKTPAYSLNLVRTAIEKHDLAQFERHVDLQSVYDRGFDSLMQAELKRNGESDNALLLGLVTNVKAGIVDTLVTTTKKYVETGKFSKQDGQDNGAKSAKNMGIVPKVNAQRIAFKDIRNTEKDGKVAVVTLEIHDTQVDKDFDINVNMRELEDGTWQVVELSNLAEFTEAYDKAVQEKLAELNQPVSQQIDAAIHVNGLKATLARENGFIPTAYLQYSLSYTLPDADKKIASLAGTAIIKDQDGNIISKKKYSIDAISKSYVASDYTRTKEFTYQWTSKDSLNPFISNEKKIIDNGLGNDTISFIVTSVTFTDGTKLELLKALPQGN
jgi:hypothetical protein